MSERLLEISVVAKRLNCSYSTVRRMIDDPDSRLKAVRLRQRTIRIVESSVDDLLRERELKTVEISLSQLS